MRIFIVDAFTDRPFAGNPAGVCPLDSDARRAADPDWMQRVAAELKHSETAFTRPLGETWELRWFTPKTEVALCGHATMATAHALFESGLAPAGQPIRFQTRHSGVLTVRPGQDGLLEMDFPADPAVPADVPPGLAEALGVPVTAVRRSAQNDRLLVLADEETVRKVSPDFAALAAIDARGICVTAPGSGSYDFVSRFFAPAVGIDEDPVTGSAHCVLGPYWADRLGRDELIGYQASERGGEVRIKVSGDRVILGGRAVTILEGDLRC